MRKVFEPVTDTTKKYLWKVNKNFKGNFIKNKKTLENSSDKLLKILNVRGIIASHLPSLLSKITNPEHTSQFKLVKDPNSKRVNDILISTTLPVTLFKNLLTFRPRDKEFELQADLLKMMTNKNYNGDLANLSDKKMYEFARKF